MYENIFIHSFILFNILKNTKEKCQFDELKSCFPMTT